MDPIAHTLAGATLAQTRLGKTTPLATATLVIGANLPDIDAVTTFLGSDTSLYLRRGVTHGVAAMVILPLLLTAGVMAFDRFIRRRRAPDKEPIRPAAVLGLSYLGVLSHPFLDWLNTYGVRLLMPFDGRWFYGDTLFIIDPWVWLLLGATVVFSYSRTKLSKTAWILFALGASALVTLVPIVPLAAKVLWWIGVAVVVALRLRGVDERENQILAVVCVAAFCVYLAAMMAGNDLARQGVQDYLDDQDALATELMTGPLPANPFAREVLAVTDTHYHGIRVRLVGEPRFEPIYDPVPIEPPDEIVSRALVHDGVRGFVNWVRFPTYEVRELDQGYQVIIRDLRYVRPDAEPGQAIGIATVLIPDE